MIWKEVSPGDMLLRGSEKILITMIRPSATRHNKLVLHLEGKEPMPVDADGDCTGRIERREE
jgi:hypothetical protein